jgi:type VI secretion system protein ImpC
MTPKAKVRYQIQIEDSVVVKELPFVIGVLADLSGKPDEPLSELRYRQFVDINCDHFDEVLEGMQPRLAFRVDNKLTDDDTQLAIELRFKSIDDFHPERIANQVEPLRRLVENRTGLSNLLIKMMNRPRFAEILINILSSTESTEQLAQELGLELEPSNQLKPSRGLEYLNRKYGESDSPEEHEAIEAELVEERILADRIMYEGGLVRSEVQRDEALLQLATLIDGVLKGEVVIFKSPEDMINARISQIDKIISDQLDEIMHHPEFQNLEASWRALHFLVAKTETCAMLKVRVLNVKKQELLIDLEHAGEFVQSALFEKVYDEEYGTWGGEPFGVLVGDYQFANYPQDLSLLEKISKIASVARTPFVTALSSQFLELDSFLELRFFRNLKDYLSQGHFAKWNYFRKTKESNYVVLVLPHILVRLPYGKNNVPVDAFDFEEDVEADKSRYLWGNAAYALASLLAEAFSRYHWCSAIRGVQNGGLVHGLTHSVRTDNGNELQIGPTEVIISDYRATELADLGFTPLVGNKRAHYAAFFATQSCHNPKMRDKSDAENYRTVRASTQLQYILAVSRFSHYISSIMRDYLGYFRSTAECEDYLNEWISKYVQNDKSNATDTGLETLLREAKIKLLEDQECPVTPTVHITLTPCYQLQESLCVPTELKIQPPDQLPMM